MRGAGLGLREAKLFVFGAAKASPKHVGCSRGTIGARRVVCLPALALCGCLGRCSQVGKR